MSTWEIPEATIPEDILDTSYTIGSSIERINKALEVSLRFSRKRRVGGRMMPITTRLKAVIERIYDDTARVHIIDRMKPRDMHAEQIVPVSVIPTNSVEIARSLLDTLDMIEAGQK